MLLLLLALIPPPHPLALSLNLSITTLTFVTAVIEQIKSALEGMVVEKAKIARVLGANDKVQKEKCFILIHIRKTIPDSCSTTISGGEQP